MMTGTPLLSLLIWVPVLGGLAVLAAGETRASLARWASLAISLVTLALSLLLVAGFDSSTSVMQFVEMRPWIESFDIYYQLGVDGIALPLILLTTCTYKTR